MKLANKQIRNLAEAYLNGEVELDKESLEKLGKDLMTAAGYRLFTKHHICHGVHYYPTEECAILAGLAVKLRGEKVVGGLYNGMECGRDSTFDHVDKQYGLVFGVTVA